MKKLIRSALMDSQSRQPGHSVASQYYRADNFARYVPKELTKCN